MTGSMSTMNQVVNMNGDEVPKESKLDSKSKTKPGVEKLNKRTREYSDVWNYFTKMGKDKDGVERATYNGCERQYKYGGKKYGTSFVTCHLLKCPMKKFYDIRQMIIGADGK